MLLHRLFVQIERILKIYEMLFIVDEVLEAARPSLVIGATALQRYRASKRSRSQVTADHRGKAENVRLIFPFRTGYLAAVEEWF